MSKGKEVIKLEDRVWDIICVLAGVLAEKALEELIETLRKKTPRAGKHWRS